MKSMYQPFDPRQEMYRPDFEIFHSRDSQLQAVGLHHHDFYEIYYFIGGAAQYQIEGKVYRLRPGDLLLVSPAELHQVSVLSQQIPYERIVLWISRGFLEQLSGVGPSLTQCFESASAGYSNLLVPTDGARVRQLLEWLLEERAAVRFAAEACSRGYLLELLVLLNRLALQSPSAAAEERSFVPRAVAYLNRHYAEAVTLDDLAAQLHVSKYHLCHTFSREAGTSVYRYLLFKRLQITREQILQGTPPGQAAAACGFQDYPNFYRAFKARYGESPSQCASGSRA